MSVDLSIRTVNAEQLAAHHHELAQLYRLCFAGPPWNESSAQLAKFPQRLAGQLAHPGAGGIVATDNVRVIAAIYGWPAAPELPVTSAFDRALAATVTPAPWRVV